MPTKSNNIGGRGGKRPGAGRKKTAASEKAKNGNPGGLLWSSIFVTLVPNNFVFHTGLQMVSDNHYKNVVLHGCTKYTQILIPVSYTHLYKKHCSCFKRGSSNA